MEEVGGFVLWSKEKRGFLSPSVMLGHRLARECQPMVSVSRKHSAHRLKSSLPIDPRIKSDGYPQGQNFTKNKTAT